MYFIRKALKRKFLEYKHRKKKLKVGYGCFIYNCDFELYNTIYSWVSLSQVSLGDFTYIGKECSISNCSIGKYCSVGPGVKIGLGTHPTNSFVSTHPIFYSTRKQAQISFVQKELFCEIKKIVIGNDVWVGANTVIVDGVKIGDGAIIGAGSVITNDVEPFAIVGGVPGKLIRKRFSDNEIKFLLELKWWNKSIEWIKKNKDYFINIEFLVRNYSNR